MLADPGRLDVDQVVCLGDHAQGGPQPAECLELLRELGCPAVMGNSDHFLLTLDPGEEEATEAQIENAQWSQSQLTEELLAFHRSFQPTVEPTSKEGGPCSPSTDRRVRATRSSARGSRRRRSASRSWRSRRRSSPAAEAVVRAIEDSGLPHPEQSLELWRQRGTPT
jgi:hypothetical protein